AVDIASPALLHATLEAARADNLLIQIHAAQYPFEISYVREHYDDTPIGFLHREGFLGPDIILGHCVFTSGHPLVGGDPDRGLDCREWFKCRPLSTHLCSRGRSPHHPPALSRPRRECRHRL